MGQKVNSNAVRLGISQGWKSSWFANSKQMYKENVAQDLIIKKFVKKAFRPAGLEDVIVRRNGNMVEVEVSVEVLTQASAAPLQSSSTSFPQTSVASELIDEIVSSQSAPAVLK